jgi:hypothetical protein
MISTTREEERKRWEEKEIIIRMEISKEREEEKITEKEIKLQEECRGKTLRGGIV